MDAMIEREPLTVILSKMGWIRAIKGHQPLDAEVKFRDGDGPLMALHAETTDKLMIFGQNGRFYTLSANALAMHCMRANLEKVMTQAAYDHMLPLAARLAEGLRRVIGKHGLNWSVTELGARCEFQFCATPPRTGADACPPGSLVTSSTSSRPFSARPTTAVWPGTPGKTPLTTAPPSSSSLLHIFSSA